MRVIERIAGATGALVLFVVGSGGLALANGVFTADSMKFALPAPHEPGDGDFEAEPSRNGQPLHFRGEDCSRCHVEGGKATNYVFTMSGTAYRDYEGTEPLEGAEIVLQDSSGQTISMKSNQEGNFYTRKPLVGTNYKAWVLYEDRVLPMCTVPAIGTTQSWMSCNMHHSPGSTRGALFMPTGKTLRSYPTSNISWRNDVRPLFLAQCRACHVPASSAPITKQVVDGKSVAFDYSGGLDLTSYAALAQKREEKPELVSTSDPDASTLLRKVLVDPTTVHAGGRLWKPSDPDYRLVRQWIAEGARDN